MNVSDDSRVSFQAYKHHPLQAQTCQDEDEPGNKKLRAKTVNTDTTEQKAGQRSGQETGQILVKSLAPE